MGHYFNPNIPKRGLDWVVDFANFQSYPGSGSNIFDLNNRINNLTITGSPTFSSTGASSNLAFSGTGQYAGKVSVTNGALIQGPITVNVIFSPSSISSQNIIALFQGGTAGLQIGTFGTTGNIWKNGGAVLLTYTYAGIGSVMHLAYTCDGANNSKVYVNGQLNNSGTVATQTGTADNYSLATFNSTGSQLFNGKIYYASIHKVVLTDNEVASMYHALKRRWGFSGIGTNVYEQVIGGVGGAE
jgi:hypothetical protein